MRRYTRMKGRTWLSRRRKLKKPITILPVSYGIHAQESVERDGDIFESEDGFKHAQRRNRRSDFTCGICRLEFKDSYTYPCYIKSRGCDGHVCATCFRPEFRVCKDWWPCTNVLGMLR